VFAHYSKTKCPRNSKIDRKVGLPTPCATTRTSFKVKVTRSTNAEIKNVSYLPKANFKLGTQMEHVDPITVKCGDLKGQGLKVAGYVVRLHDRRWSIR